MQVVNVTLDRRKARDLYRAYKSHKAYQRPEDYEIMRSYQLIAQGRTVINALESIRQAGVDLNGLPKLAICRADQTWCYLEKNEWGGGMFSGKTYPRNNDSQHITFPNGFFPRSNKKINHYERVRAVLPIIPPQHRPNRGLANYHILWEAEWDFKPPVDPYLLRRIAKSDFWMVLAAWDLTEVEQAALKTRMLII